MALQTKISFKSIDKAGLLISLVNNTGNFSTDNPGGYGAPNASIGDFSRIILTLSQYSISEIYRQTYVRINDPLHPEYLLSPTLNQIAAGADMMVNSVTLGVKTYIDSFQDGVFDLNMYHVVSASKTGIIAARGTSFISGAGLDPFMDYDSVLIGDQIIDIDKTKGTNGGTLLFLVQEILVSATSFNPLYRANTKFITNIATTTCLYNKIGKMACDCGNSKLRDQLSQVDMFRWMAQHAFDNGDYVQANDFIISAQFTCEGPNCGC